ncbi:MAG: hypothetical protein PHO34_05800 [Candidatus Omnitrophica bacterium]|nr:hypothetical protein [Candidatus Omnitrophota bacterium]MDD5042557.1 hypothetical protein [Candidatus Omnitrophota bacterium]MDD5501065.1 hypothetical protein [Candidatus Omnitrophota bacterium]
MAETGEKNKAAHKLNTTFSILLVLCFIGITSLALSLNSVNAKLRQQAMVIAEKDKQLEADKVQYTSLAARLHKEIKKAGELETELKKYKR